MEAPIIVDIRSQILARATQLIAARGFDGTSLRSIADAVGIRKPSVLYHFPSKAALRQAVLEQLLSHWNEVVPRLLMATTAEDGMERFDAIMAELMGFFARDPDRARLLLREMLDRPDDMRSYMLEFVKPWMDVVAKNLRAGQRSGLVRSDVDPEAWVLHVANSSLATLAMADGAGCLLNGAAEAGGPETNPSAGRDRYLNEMVRAARVSLFSRPAPETNGGPRE